MSKWKDDCIIYIPTYQRIDSQVTIRKLPKSAGVDKGRVVLVAPKNEAKKLERKWDVPVLVQPDDVVNIAQKRAWIIEQCRHERMIMLDDDLRFAYRPTFKVPKFITPDENHRGAETAWTLFEESLEYFAHGGLGAKNGAQSKNEMWQFNSRVMYALGYRTRTIQKECELGRIRTREDMDYTLQLLRKGYRNIIGYRLVVDQTYAKAGGMTEERTIKRSNKDAELIASWYPGLIKVEERQYKQSIPRKEVTVAWKKAFDLSKSTEEETLRTRKFFERWGYDTKSHHRQYILGLKKGKK